MKNKKMTLLVMAAGNGSRYGALKQFDELGPKGEFLFEYSIYDAVSNGFDHIVIITKPENVDGIRDYLKKKLPENIDLDVVAQRMDDLPVEINSKFTRKKPWGTAHAVWVARNVIDSDFVVINADDYYGSKAFQLSADFIQEKQEKDEYALVPYFLKETLSKHGTVSRGFCKAEGNYLKEIRELIEIEEKEGKITDIPTGTSLKSNDYVSMNLWVCDPGIFNLIENRMSEFLKDPEKIETSEVYIPIVIQELMEQGLVKVKLTSPGDQWFGVTYVADKANAVETLKMMSENHTYPMPLWKI